MKNRMNLSFPDHVCKNTLSLIIEQAHEKKDSTNMITIFVSWGVGGGGPQNPNLLYRVSEKSPPPSNF